MAAAETAATRVDMANALMIKTTLIIFGLALALLHLWRSRLNVVLAIAGAGILGWLLFPAAG